VTSHKTGKSKAMLARTWSIPVSSSSTPFAQA
jgi:hypothetical protein